MRSNCANSLLAKRCLKTGVSVPPFSEKSARLHFLPQMIGGLAREFLDDALELRELLASKALLEDGRERAAFFREKRKITLRPPNVPCKDQVFPPPNLLNRFNEPIVASMGCTTVCRHVRAEDQILSAPNFPRRIVARWRSWRRSRRREWDPPAPRLLRRCRRDRRAWRHREHSRSGAWRRRCARCL